MNDRSQVEVLNEERLRSELAMYVWAQSEIMRSQRELGVAEPRDESSYHTSKASLYAGVVKLAGARMTRLELIEKLRTLLSEGPNAEIAKLDPAQIASRICHQAK